MENRNKHKVQKILNSSGNGEKASIKRTKKYRVAAYCRVSTQSEKQETSFEMQVQVYTERILQNPKWVLADIYADKGITGTEAKKRPEFQRMVADCEAGKVDIILTKSLSRFARNTLECLTYIRHLQGLGVRLLFEKENIDTDAVFSEMLLTILAAFAQEESRSLSENLKWGIRKRFEEGIDRWTNIYGYTQSEEGNYQIVPEEATIVRKVFELYEHGNSISEIVAYMKTNRIPSPDGKAVWAASAVHIILRNEKYVGDILLQKKYTTDHISHKEIRNDFTEVPAYYIANHHIPLVSRKTFERTQTIRKMQYQGGNSRGEAGQHVQYPFGDMLRCPFCGSALSQRHIPVQAKTGKGWLCQRGQHPCGLFLIRSWFVEEAVLRAYDELDMKAVEDKLRSKDQNIARAAQDTLAMKAEHPAFERVDYYWLDELVEYITFGRHSNMPRELAKLATKKIDAEDDRTLIVFWKCGLRTTVFSGIEKDKDMPQRLLELYNRYLERKGKPRTDECTGGDAK